MSGKKKGKGPQQQLSQSSNLVKQQTTSESLSSPKPQHPIEEKNYDRLQKLDQITQQLKALSPKKKEEISEEVVPTRQNNSNMDGKPREDVMEERQRKKAEKAALKAQKAAQKTENNLVPQKQPSQSQKSSTKMETDENKERPKADLKIVTQNLPEPKSVLKQVSPPDMQKEKSNLKVRFDLQPGNNNPAAHSQLKSKSKFILATPDNVHPSFRRLAAKCEANKLPGFNELLYEFHGTLIEVIFFLFL
jgi:hypothetical protein